MLRTLRLAALIPLPLFVLAAASSFAAAPPQPIALHPENPHYFLWRDQPTILITSGEHYGALLNLDFDYVPYFEELKSKGLNHTRTFSGVYREVPSSFGITDNPLAPRPGRYLCPWARSHEPGYYDGGNKFDLARWDPDYFKRLADFMRQAQSRGIVVEMNLFCPMYEEELWKACPMNAANNVNGIGTCPREEIYTLQHPDLTAVQVAVVRKIVSELRDFDNLYYEVCNEPYERRTALEWQHKIVDTIVEAEKDFPAAKHLISMNVANGRAKVENPHPAVSIFNFHYCVPPDAVALNYGLNRVIDENETGFRGHGDLVYRTEAWDFLLAGGGLFNNLDYSFTPKSPDGSFRQYKSPGGGSPELRQQLAVLKEFLYGLDFIHMSPAAAVIDRTQPQLVATALAQPGKAYAIYLHVPLPQRPTNLEENAGEDIEATISLDLAAGKYKAEWVNTKTGNVDQTTRLDHGGGIKELTSPKFSGDIALRLVRQE